ncbi:MAG TPA: M56 family metallopeptidase [Gemmatimonadaceae bacterium]|nr:M56 family metallopeptidase [Gemmatimonadaceae bacterium]
MAALAVDRLASLAGRPQRIVWATTLMLTACWPLLSLLFSAFSLSSADGASAQFAEVHKLSTLIVASPALQVPPGWTRIVILGWLVCSALLVARLVIAFAYFRRRDETWRPTNVDGTHVQVARDVGPAVVGIHRMVIVLPEWAIEADPALRAVVLRHEEEHRLARDPYLLLLAAVVTAVVPWNIPLWFQAARLRLAIEIDCDKRVLRTLPSWREYASLLLTIAQHRSRASHALIPALLEPTSNLERRITAMRSIPGLTRLNALLLTSACGLALTLACAVEKPESPSASPSIQRTAGAAAVSPQRVDPAQKSFFEFQVEKLATPITMQNVQYPPELKAAGVKGTVYAQFVVDETGHVDISTFTVLNDVDPRLSAAVRDVAASWRFEPASVGGRKVKQLVQQPFQFGT